MPDHLTDGAIWLVGAGPMSRAYAAVLQEQGHEPVVVGRGETSAAAFTAETGLDVRVGGLQQFLGHADRRASAAIVATPVSDLADDCIRLVEHGVPRILVEKPAGLDGTAIGLVRDAAARAGAQVFVAYNRRFYASALHARRLAEHDGGVTSFSFEFTEFADRIAATPHPAEVKRNWFLANSTHVVDLAFHLGGWPRSLTAHTAGALPWHPAGAVFAGAGVASTGAPFSYQANWDAPGRWAVELLTRRRRLVLRPLEGLQEQLRNSVELGPVEIDDELDRRFKPGLFRQVTAFVDGDCASSLWSVEHQARAVTDVYEPMLAGQPQA